MSVQIKTPGKLMVAGEFAVLELYHKLIVMAVDRFVYVTVEESRANLLVLENFNLHDITWSYHNNVIVLSEASNRTSFVKAALQVTYDYLSEQGYELGPLKITVKSELDDKSGKKYGLGSSAAVVTAVVQGVLQSGLGYVPEEMLVFKLASIAHVIVQGNGSGADIAASSFGGVIEYASFQAEWLIEAYEKAESIVSFIESDWVYLSINQVKFLPDIKLMIGWTGNPASTGSLVNELLKMKQKDLAAYNTFLNESEAAVALFLEGLMEDRKELVFMAVEMNRKALSSIGKRAHVDIETEKLAILSELVKDKNGAGKLSGAGGGDCGIAFLPLEADESNLKSA